MTFGLVVKNESFYVQIDSETPRLCAVYNGRYLPSGRFSYVIFPAPITTAEPPCIFIQNSPSRPDDIYDGMTVNGGPGAWTGFTLSSNNTSYLPTGKWFAAVFASKSTADYGVRIWGAEKSVIYDSGAVPIIFTRANHAWAYQGVVTVGSQGRGYAWRNALTGPLLSDEYFMINPLSRGVLQYHFNAATLGVRFNYSGSYLQVYSFSAISPWTDLGSPAAVFARLPGT